MGNVLLWLFTLIGLMNRPTSSLNVTDLRLVGGDYPSEGRVEVRGPALSGGWTEWGTVCDDGWSYTDAAVLCRQLGFNGIVRSTDRAEFGSGAGPILLDDVECDGSESRIQDCDYEIIHNCQHNEDAGVICQLPGYLGCFRDSARDRVLPHARLKSPAVHALQCIGRCHADGYAFAGVENGDECYCGYEDTDYGRQGAEDENDCNTECRGDENLLCGGRGRIGVFDARRAHCLDPGTPIGGARTGDSFIFGSFVNFSCADGLELTGAARLQCMLHQGNESLGAVGWSAEIPHCEGFTTQALETTPLSTTIMFSASSVTDRGTNIDGAVFGLILGPTLGALLLLLILIVSVLVWKRRRRNKSRTSTDQNETLPASSSVNADPYYNTLNPSSSENTGDTDQPVYCSVRSAGRTDSEPRVNFRNTSVANEYSVKRNSTHDKLGDGNDTKLGLEVPQITPLPCGDGDVEYTMLYEDNQPASVDSLNRETKMAVLSSQGLAHADGAYSLLYGGDGEGDMGTLGETDDVDLPLNNPELEDQFKDHIYGVLEEEDNSSA